MSLYEQALADRIIDTPTSDEETYEDLVSELLTTGSVVIGDTVMTL